MRRPFAAVAAAIAACAMWTAPVSAQWQIDSKDGKSNIKIGFLAQPQLEWLKTPDHSDTSVNLFVRRIRVLFAGNIGERWSFFLETDSPNLGKGSVNPGAATKDAGDVFIQDAYVTYTHSAVVKIDAGMMLLPHSRNGTQSGATLLAVDYGPYTFIDSGPSGERVGRDYGVQLRGYPAKQHIEYRLAVSQGVRGSQSTNPLRVSARAVYYPFGAEAGFFYAGTFQGTKKQAGIGGGFDMQDDSRIYSADVFFETPTANKTQGLTVQANWMRYDGGTFISTLSEQQAWLVEGGYHLLNHRLTPFVQFQVRNFAADLTPDQNHLQIGAAYWMAGHQRTLKISAGRIHVQGQPSRTQVLAQLQVFYF